MAEEDIFEITWSGLDEFSAELQGLYAEMQNELVTQMKNYLNLVEEGAKALAFRFGGDLEQSIIAMPVKIDGHNVKGSVGTNMIYAWRLHERPYKTGKRDLHDNGIRIPDYYINSRGKRTRDKQKWRGQLPGRKYLERAIVATEEEFTGFMEEVLIRVIRSDD